MAGDVPDDQPLLSHKLIKFDFFFILPTSYLLSSIAFYVNNNEHCERAL